MQNDTRLTAEEAAALAGFKNVKTFERYVAAGKLPITRWKVSLGANAFYSKNDIEALLEKTKLKIA